MESPVFAQLGVSKENVFDGKKEGPETNVTARLFNSNRVKTVLPAIIEGIRGILGLDDVKTLANKATQKGEVQIASKSSAVKAIRDSIQARTPATDQNHLSSENEGAEDAFTQYDDRLASSSESENEEEEFPPFRSLKSNYDPIRDLSLSSTPSVADSDSPPPIAKGSKSRKASEKSSTTTFLPSLTMGGYWSGTESEAEDDQSAAAALATRKNRMGQQARRKLWEKKYGQNANHVRKQTDSSHRDRGWDVRRGATSQDYRGKDRGPDGRFASRSKIRGSALARDDRLQRPRVSARQAQEEKPIHPSWEAARKAKEKKSQASFQGKKLVFD